MPVVEWDRKLETGHPLVDQQHQELFRLINSLHDGIVSGRAQPAITATLDGLARYVAQHFAVEEELMRTVAYPAAAAHRAEHAKLTAEATKIIADYRSGRVTLSVTLSMFLVTWLNHHIREVDQRMIAFVRKAAPGL